jgi:hypothetical protein
MKKNLGNADRIVRVLIFAITVVLFLSGIVNGALAYILMGVGAVLLVTSFINFCPIYAVLGINSNKTK